MLQLLDYEILYQLWKIAPGSQHSSRAKKIRTLETRIDTLQQQLSSIEKYIRNNYGVRVWKDIKNKFISKAN